MGKIIAILILIDLLASVISYVVWVFGNDRDAYKTAIWLMLNAIFLLIVLKM
jgi:hypothetical protein